MMDYLQGNFEQRCKTTGAPTEVSFFTATFSSILLVLNIPGNLLLILAVAIDPYKNLRNPFNYLMINLALADLLAGTVTDPLNISYGIKEGLNKTISTGEIRSLHMFYFIAGTASVLSLALLSIERYYAICHPINYRLKITGKRVLTLLSGIWFVSLTLPFIYLEVDFITCAFILLNTTVFAAVAITCFTYGVMIYKFNGHRRDQLHITTGDNNQRPDGHLDPAPKNNRQDLRVITSRDMIAVNDKTVIWEQKVTKRFLVVMVALLLCYGPATILIYVTSFCASCSCTVLHWFRDLQILFILMNSSMNFFCYGLRSSRFRRAFARILGVRDD